MAKDYFQFKRFTIRQDCCGMKVGTDGTLLGAWARGGADILDVGTGTGLIALMMAQRFPDARVTGIDIDESACLQAEKNVASSPFEVKVILSDLKDLDGCFDCIVSNPPYFCDSLQSPDAQRTLARHTASLSYASLMENAWRLLAEEGEFSLVIPSEGKAGIECEAAVMGFFKVRECAVKTTPQKLPRRYLLAFRKHPAPSLEKTIGLLQDAPNVRSAWYHELTKDFYL